MSQGVSKNLEQHYARLAVSVERLSSGLRINSAADDAAGLAIRELMRADVAALNQGVRNASDAISMIQVADGALGVIDEKLIRMKELAEQAATGTYNSTQRLIIDSEYKAMAAEIDRIARATDFNGIKLLDGSLSGAHNGGGLNSTGAMKIHFGNGNDSAEDYYYINIGDCTTAGLGLGVTSAGGTGAMIRVETFEKIHKTFKPSTSYIEYNDPTTGQKYYSDGDFYFTSLDNPAGTTLNWETEGAVIERLRMEPATTQSSVGYGIAKDPNTGKEYYTRNNHGIVVTDPHDPEGTLLDASDPASKAIIDRLVDTPTDVYINTEWKVYEDKNGQKFYTCDGGRTYVPDVKAPASNILDTRNPAHKAIINNFSAVMKAAEVKPPAVRENYYIWEDPGNRNFSYLSNDGGKTFVTQSNPDKLALDPNIPWQKTIIDRLVPKYVTHQSFHSYGTYRDPVAPKYYYTDDDGVTFVGDIGDPAGSVLSDPVILGRLEPDYKIETRTVKYATYEDTANGHKRYYSRDNGKTYFDDLNDPKGSALDPSAPGYSSLVANFVALSTTTEVMTRFRLYRPPSSSTLYLSADEGQTFYDSRNLETLALDSSNPADKAVIDTLKPVLNGASYKEDYIQYEDPGVTGRYQYYYTKKGGTGEQFVLSALQPENIALDASDPAQKQIIDRLVPVQDKTQLSFQKNFPDIYYVYEDPASGTIYYKPEPDGLLTSRPNDPYNSRYQLDPANAGQKQIIDRLRPVVDVARVEKYVEVATPGTGVACISTQQSAQEALEAIDRAIVSKDKIRAHLGALQNRLENTVTNLTIMAENLLSAESRISDADIGAEMMTFVRNQVLTQASVAMLSQANTWPHMMMNLIGG